MATQNYRPEVITAVPTGFTPTGEVDLEASRAILEFVAASGNEGAFPLGTTGEFPSLSRQERGGLAALAVQVLSPHMRVIVHVGAASLFEVLRHIEQAREAGAREIAVLTPYYLPITDQALLDFFTAVDRASSGLRVFVYVYAKRSNNAVSPRVMQDLSRLPNIAGAKVSEEPLSLLGEYRDVVPEDFTLYTGADRDLLGVSEHGAQGVVSGVSSVLPKPFRAAAEGARSRDEVQADVDQAVSAIAGDVGRMHYAYELLGVRSGTCRMSIEAPDEQARAAVEEAVTTLG
ncbi:dihydrodipicolinate synthase family protein [Brachybacterium sacelli]|uniref:4-hydroxy-tetrahydrodipicolinate synthase n=1 Tax=Brachybacterium sacelli TaxID=173364 RepID=A0ABS4WZD5_9MICO|nr:dihydrodipicolinate synthase family protein [Brachybacterium sacelli]MBP2381576.1 4-hydroxy-tetrahydrodipicolinate synthase [Brachybacterium sacelli]